MKSNNRSKSVFKIVDDIYDRTPGTIDGKRLVKIAVQKERRIFKKLMGKKIKNVIYQLRGTKEIWYKNNDSAIGAISMGFSMKRKDYHPKSVPMEFYYEAFTEPSELINRDYLSAGQADTIRKVKLTYSDWLSLNDYVLVEP